MLDIRTYGVVSLNEEAGLIQWVPNTVPIRPILLRLYDRQGISSWVSGLATSTAARPSTPSQNAKVRSAFDQIKAARDNDEAAQIFRRTVLGM